MGKNRRESAFAADHFASLWLVTTEGQEGKENRIVRLFGGSCHHRDGSFFILFQDFLKASSSEDALGSLESTHCS